MRYCTPCKPCRRRNERPKQNPSKNRSQSKQIFRITRKNGWLHESVVLVKTNQDVWLNITNIQDAISKSKSPKRFLQLLSDFTAMHRCTNHRYLSHQEGVILACAYQIKWKHISQCILTRLFAPKWCIWKHLGLYPPGLNPAYQCAGYVRSIATSVQQNSDIVNHTPTAYRDSQCLQQNAIPILCCRTRHRETCRTVSCGSPWFDWCIIVLLDCHITLTCWSTTTRDMAFPQTSVTQAMGSQEFTTFIEWNTC